jgi:KDO2-lipid IV(A) lauroyltransferase
MYYLVLPLMYFISYMPFRVLYVISDVLYFFLYKIFRYRKQVVLTNLKNSFPEKSDQEINVICDQFYSYLCDLMVETIKTLTITPKEVLEHVKMPNEDLVKKYFDKNQSVIFVLGHMGNWELCGARFSQSPFHQLFVIYHPLSNKKFDALLYHMRTRLGNGLYAMNDALRGMIKNRSKVTATAFIADQTPFPEGAYWTTFLNQDTPVFIGTEKISSKLNYPVIYASVKRSKRGVYEIQLEELFENPKDTTEGQISEAHTRRLEKDIIEQPEIWLWTHKRWKYKRPTV